MFFPQLISWQLFYTITRVPLLEADTLYKQHLQNKQKTPRKVWLIAESELSHTYGIERNQKNVNQKDYFRLNN